MFSMCGTGGRETIMVKKKWIIRVLVVQNSPVTDFHCYVLQKKWIPLFTQVLGIFMVIKKQNAPTQTHCYIM